MAASYKSGMRGALVVHWGPGTAAGAMATVPSYREPDVRRAAMLSSPQQGVGSEGPAASWPEDLSMVCKCFPKDARDCRLQR